MACNATTETPVLDMSDYKILAAQVRALAEEDAHWAPVLSNASALVMETLPRLNWAGFYLVRDGQLVLGPFQGKVACVHIARGRGVCGTAWEQDRAQHVHDVHEFPGHIACDSASNSEVVVPLHASGEVVGVLDVDSPLVGRFSDVDAEGLALVAQAVEEVADFSDLR
ncbi:MULTISPECIES: GAF domain-containing protein [Atopobiaceae]|uniref:GAF domain-containing protein n=1 Tax=Parafannyhessea umbonata TaxID=604330 RepID=A0A1H9PGL8_9ACTN|nr:MULTISPECIES: GAF domain-containing protein [Atopobiaceae]SEH50424.1 GAF domain-containing protein [Parafannyhessea umbonata]SER47436.1 GAF domain-containing protein [Parafannyhessea umbonata]SJZ76969.1 GAF domain-containing protein [Olsenella sp. KH1P3]